MLNVKQGARVGCKVKNTISLTTRRIQIRSFTLVFFALVTKLRERKTILVSHLHNARP